MKVNMSDRGVVAFVLLGLISVVLGNDQTYCHKTSSPMKHYTELGCKPKYKGHCIDQYDCPFIKNPPGPDKCYFNGHTFNIGDSVSENFTKTHCVAVCVCVAAMRNGGKAVVICAIVDCFGFLHKSCIPQYTLESCCFRNKVCEPEAIAALKTCTWESKDYKEGERFYPTGSCKQCICTKDFDGTIKSPYCQEIDCGFGLMHPNPALDKSGPIYYEGQKERQNCCPISWQHASATDQITRKPEGNIGKPGPKCHYGNNFLNIGDTVQGNDSCVSCSCDVPPLISCVRKDDC